MISSQASQASSGPDATSSAYGALRAYRDADPSSRWRSTRIHASGIAGTLDLTCEYEPEGTVRALTTSGERAAFGYDDFRRLTQVTYGPISTTVRHHAYAGSTPPATP